MAKAKPKAQIGTIPVYCAHTEIVSLAKLVPNPRNPNQHPEAQVRALAHVIEGNGWRQPITVSTRSGFVVKGHGRLLAARHLGLDAAPVDFQDYATEAEEWADLIADNRLAELSEIDNTILRDLLEELDTGDFDMDLTGFDAEALEALMTACPPEPGALNGDPDEVPEPPAEPITKPGDLIILGRHRLLCGDSRDFSAVERLMDGRQINVCVTSPPYASQREYDPSSGFKPIHPDEFVEWYRDVAANIMAHIADDGSYFCNIKEHCDDGERHLYVKDLTIAHKREWGWRYIDELIWRRPGFPGGWDNRFKCDFEPIFHFSKGKRIKFYPEAVGTEGITRKYTGKDKRSKTGSGFTSGSPGEEVLGIVRPGNVLDFPRARGEAEHSAMFAVELPEFFIKGFSAPGDAVYDPFMGSGTTLIAAEQTGRLAFGMELSPQYCDVIVARWEKLTGQRAQRPE